MRLYTIAKKHANNNHSLNCPELCTTYKTFKKFLFQVQPELSLSHQLSKKKKTRKCEIYEKQAKKEVGLRKSNKFYAKKKILKKFYLIYFMLLKSQKKRDLA